MERGGVALASDAELADIQEQLRDWAERLATHPVADVLARVWATSGVMATCCRLRMETGT